MCLGERDPSYDLVCLCLPRGNGKSTLAAWLGARLLFDYRMGKQSHIIAASVGQARRTTFKLLREYIDNEDKDFRVSDNISGASVTHKETNTKVAVLAANHKTAQGLVDVPVIICDEPGAWDVNSGTAVWDAIETAQGKPGMSMKIILIGTLAPNGIEGSWWHKLVKGGSHGTTYVQVLQADHKKWEDEAEIERVNPLMWLSLIHI